MTRKSKILLALAALWGIFIFCNSLQNGETSTQLSDAVVFRLPRWLDWVDVHTLTVIVRKSAHFCEYAVLSLLSSFVFHCSGKFRWSNIGNILFPCLLWAVADEFLQTFVEGRTGLVGDVVIDFAGVLTGCLAALLVVWVQKRGKHTRPV